MDKKPKLFIGKVNFFRHEQYGDKIKLALNRDHVKMLVDKINSGKEWVTVLLHTNKSGVWYAEIDTWEPKQAFNNLPVQKMVGQQIPQANQARFTEEDFPEPDQGTIPF